MRKNLPTILAVLLVSASTHAQWISDPTINNRVTNVAGTKADLHAIPDGSGGMLLTWTDSRNSDTTGTDIYFQRILNNGTLAFDSAGILVCNAVGNQSNPKVVAAAGGAAIIVWQDSRTANNNAIYGQKISSAGVAQWAANGVVVADATGNQNSPEAVSDGAGGAVVFFQDNRVSGVELYAQRIDGNGTPLWATDGVAIATQPNSQNAQTIVADGTGHYFLAWSDGRLSNSNSDIFVQKIDNTGTLLWSAATQGVNICNAANNQLTPQIALGNNGSIYVTWTDLRAGTSNLNDIYVQRVLSNGTVDPAFPANGLLVCGAANNQNNPNIVADGSGNAIITWADQRAGTAASFRDIYAQKINANGSVAWVANGVPIISGDGFTQPNSATDGFKIVSDGAGGAIIVWDDARNGTSNLDVYAQRIDGNGNALWPLGATDKAPIPVANGAANQRIPVMVSDNNAGAIVAFVDSRNDTNSDIFASRLFSNGALPVTSISLTGIEKNKEVFLSWKTFGEQNVQRFELQRNNGNGAWSSLSSIPAKSGNSNNTYHYIDSKPFAGNNFYRVKIIDRNGSISNSQTVRVAVPVRSGKIIVSPVPANNNLKVTLQEPTAGNYQLKLVDGNGRVALQQSVLVSSNMLQLQVPIQIQSLATGMYRLVVTAQDGSIIATVPVQKQ
jgi:hypothetical protein